MSESKIEMLYQQLPDADQTLTTEIGFDAKLLRGSRTISASPNIHRKLHVVEDWLHANEQLGTIDDPQPWILQRCQLWGLRLLDVFEGEPPVMLFAETAAGNQLLLGGSARNLTGSVPDSEDRHSASHPLYLYEYVEAMARAEEQKILISEVSDPYERVNLEGATSGIAVLGDMVAEGHVKGTLLGECEVLAKSLGTAESGWWKDEPFTSTLATPLYVALCD